MKWIVRNEHQLAEIATEIISNLPKTGVVLLQGQIGVGKTTTMRTILSILSNDSFQGSPTFSLVNEYKSKCGQSIYHFDLFRIKHSYELQEIGIEEYFENGSLSFIEWPEKSLIFLPNDKIWMYISVGNKNERIIELKNDY
ncbi:MAG: tRNA (adenosine(37)-N6)-threonylcarbamoyltransferase complex ATPase subunit type 1 TsaE [Bacteroidetes bacterium]|nr:tRNA (adenosine(37)-N6)-threonylcarbamoyltransferase complex ATPase subunit type 1 TsaE [Bacteroidota bacterium]